MSRSSQRSIARWLLAAACAVPSIGLWACDHEWEDLRFAGEGGASGTTSSSTSSDSTTSTISNSTTTNTGSTPTGSTTTSTGTITTSGPDCSVGACDQCIVTDCAGSSCSDLRQACDAEDACRELDQCILDCGWGDETCYAACVEQLPAGEQLWRDLYHCLACDACAGDCHDDWICW